MEFVSGENRAVFYVSLRYKVEMLSNLFTKAVSEKKRVVHITSACLPSDLRFFLGSMGCHIESEPFVKILPARDIFFRDGNLNLKRAGDIIKTDLLEATDLISIDYSWAGNEYSLFQDIIKFNADMRTHVEKSKIATTCFFYLCTFPNSHVVEIARLHSLSLFESHPDEMPLSLCNSPLSPSFSLTKDDLHMHLFEVVKENIKKQALSCGVSTQEKRVLEMMLQFKSNKIIAHELFISDNTLKQHLKAIYRKLSVDTRLSLYEKFYGPLLGVSTVQV